MKLRSKLFYTYAASFLLYAASFTSQRQIATLQNIDLSTTQYTLLSLTVLVPTAVIWYVAFYGYYKLKVYATMIKNTPDGKHVDRITTGLGILALGLPGSALTTAAINTIVSYSPGFAGNGTVIKNYVALLFPLAAFVFINKGAHGLSVLSKQQINYRTANILAGGFIIIGTIFCHLVLTANSINDLYHLPSLLVVLTLVCPYLYTWYLGIVAAYQTYLYGYTAPGKLYRQTWNLLATGIGAIIGAQIARQYISSTTLRLENLQLVRLLFIVYVLLGMLSVGFILVAAGAKRLQKIEEV